MTAILWEQVKRGFEEASQLTQPERASYLLTLADGEPEIANLVGELLAFSSASQGFLENPPWRLREDEPPRNVFSPGQLLADRFEVEAFLGAGGAGEVYRAYDRHRDLRVALKTVRSALLADKASVTGLRNELNVAIRVSHPNVCRLYDIVLPAQGESGPSFLTMELLDGETLSARIRRGGLEHHQSHLIVKQLVSGLGAAHECGVVHRDLKSGNVMLITEPSGPRVVIMDFGLARQIQPGDDLRTALSGEWLAGTPAYMAPEQLEGKRATVQSDIHSLGVVMFEMVTGRLPFEGETPVVIASARLRQQAPRPGTIVAGLDPRWDRAIMACLQRDPARRPRSAAEVLDLLETRQRLRVPRRTAAAAVLVFACTGAFVVFHRHNLRPEAQAAFDSGVVAMQNESKEGFENAIGHFQRAIRLEQEWAPPRAELAYAYAAASNSRFIDGAFLREARSEALKAIQLDRRLAKAHAARGLAESLDFTEWPLAEESFRRALALDARDGRVRFWFAAHLRKKGRFREAERQALEALALTHRQEARIWSELAFLYWTAGWKEKFRAHMAEQIVLHRNDALTRFLHARLLKYDRDFTGADSELSFSERLGMNPLTVMVERASVYAWSGDAMKARALAADLEKAGQSREIDGLLLAGVYASIGDSGQAFATLDQAYRRSDNTLLSLATSPVLESLRSDARFVALLRRLNFTPQIMQQMELSSSSARGVLRQPRRTGTS